MVTDFYQISRHRSTLFCHCSHLQLDTHLKFCMISFQWILCIFREFSTFLSSTLSVISICFSLYEDFILQSLTLHIGMRILRVTLKVGTRKWETRNGKGGNGKKVQCISFSKLLVFCYCSHQMWWASQWPSMHSLMRGHLCLTVDTKGIYATALHHGLQASSMCMFFTFGSLLAFLKVEAVDCSYFVPRSHLRLVAWMVMTHIFVSHTALLFKTACSGVGKGI